jgi:hypothetical protein
MPPAPRQPVPVLKSKFVPVAARFGLTPQNSTGDAGRTLPPLTIASYLYVAQTEDTGTQATMSELAPASFFPTPLEIAGGIRWMRAHPVVATAAAAAAATAVSVLTFLKTRAEDSEDELLFAPGAVVVGASEDEADEEDESRDAVLGSLPRRRRVRRRPAGVSVALGHDSADCHARKLSEDVCSSTDSDASSSPTRGRQSSVRVLLLKELAGEPQH